MIGVPGRHYMLLSSQLDKEFNGSEKEYVVLHEVGHYLLHHAIREGLFFLVLFVFGCFIIRKKPWYFILMIGIIGGLLYIQVGTRSEYEADHFAVSRMTNPTGMITATEKFRNGHNPSLNDYGLLWPILYRSTPYHTRIQWAKEEIRRRM